MEFCSFPLSIFQTRGKVVLFHFFPYLSSLSVLIPLMKKHPQLGVGFVVWREGTINEFLVFIEFVLLLLQLDIQLHNRKNMSGQLEIQSNDRVFRSKIGDDARLFSSLYKVFYFQLLYMSWLHLPASSSKTRHFQWQNILRIIYLSRFLIICWHEKCAFIYRDSFIIIIIIFPILEGRVVNL